MANRPGRRDQTKSGSKILDDKTIASGTLPRKGKPGHLPGARPGGGARQQVPGVNWLLGLSWAKPKETSGGHHHVSPPLAGRFVKSSQIYLPKF